MKITSLLALSALMTIGASAQTVLYSQNFDSVTFANPAATGGLIGLFSAGSSAGETSLGIPGANALGLTGQNTNNTFIASPGNTTWNNASGVPTSSNVLAINGSGFVNFTNLSLAAGHTMTVSFDAWTAGAPSADVIINFGGNQVGSTLTVAQRVKSTFTGTFTNNTASTINGIFQIDNSNNLAVDNILVTVPEPSAVLLGGFGALALLRRRRA